MRPQTLSHLSFDSFTSKTQRRAVRETEKDINSCTLLVALMLYMFRQHQTHWQTPELFATVLSAQAVFLRGSYSQSHATGIRVCTRGWCEVGMPRKKWHNDLQWKSAESRIPNEWLFQVLHEQLQRLTVSSVGWWRRVLPFPRTSASLSHLCLLLACCTLEEHLQLMWRPLAYFSNLPLVFYWPALSQASTVSMTCGFQMQAKMSSGWGHRSVTLFSTAAAICWSL